MHRLIENTKHYLQGFVGPGLTESQVLENLDIWGSTADEIFAVIAERDLQDIPAACQYWYRAKLDIILGGLLMKGEVRVANPIEPDELQNRIDLDNYYQHPTRYQKERSGITSTKNSALTSGVLA